MSRVSRLSILSAGALTAALVATMTPALAAGPAQDQTTGVPTGSSGGVFAIIDGLARHVALSLAADHSRERLAAATSSGPADLTTVVSGPSLARTVAAAERATLAAKGLGSSTGSLLQIRLAHPDMRTALARGEAPLVATAPADDQADRIAAYDTRGKLTLLDAAVLPQRPVYVVEVNTAKALSLGMEVMRQEFASRNLAAQAGPGTTASGYWATKVNAVRLSDDKEPWIKGGAEIFNIVGGFGLDGKATVNVVQMPYLDNDGTTYYPNQLLVHFNGYKYNLADVVMMEDDGDTNYQQLAIAIATALLTIVDGGVYIPLVNAILNAIPTSWWTDDPDYVDSWYTLATSSSGRRYGAAGNGWMDVVPYWVAPL